MEGPENRGPSWREALHKLLLSNAQKWKNDPGLTFVCTRNGWEIHKGSILQAVTSMVLAEEASATLVLPCPPVRATGPALLPGCSLPRLQEGLWFFF